MLKRASQRASRRRALQQAVHEMRDTLDNVLATQMDMANAREDARAFISSR